MPSDRPGVIGIAGSAVGLGLRHDFHEMSGSEAGLRAQPSGWSAVRVTDFSQVSAVTDADQWLRWVGSHGGREVARAIPAGHLPTSTALADAVDDDGIIRVVVADRCHP